MTPEEKSLLERTYALSQENNKLLRGLRRANRVSTWFHVFYWVVIILLAVGSYYLVQPYAAYLLNVLDQGQGMQAIENGFNNVKDAVAPK